MSAATRRYIRENSEEVYQRDVTEQQMEANRLRINFLKKFIINADTKYILIIILIITITIIILIILILIILILIILIIYIYIYVCIYTVVVIRV